MIPGTQVMQTMPKTSYQLSLSVCVGTTIPFNKTLQEIEGNSKSWQRCNHASECLQRGKNAVRALRNKKTKP